MIPRKCSWCGKRFRAFSPYRAKMGLGKPVCSRKCQREISKEGKPLDGCLFLLCALVAGSSMLVGCLVALFVR